MSGKVKANLIAAKALIDTPAKFSGHSSRIFRAVDLATSAARGGDDKQFQAVVDALFREMGDDETLRSFSDRPHSDIMALFDRAIAAQDATP